MTRVMLPGHPPVEIALRRSHQARRFSLRVSGLDGRVTLTLPARARSADALAFAEEKAEWLRAAVSRSVAPRPLAFGARIPYEGREIELVPGALRSRPRLLDDALILPPDPARLGAVAEAFLKSAARVRLTAASTLYAARLGRGYRRITLRDTRSRWGSCAHDGSLMYSWRLIMAPPEVLDYVAAHEVAHLAEMNHSPAYWAVLARLMPDYAPHRRWLRENGAALHAPRFRP